MEQKPTPKDVRTLLMYKIHKAHQDEYRKICHTLTGTTDPEKKEEKTKEDERHFFTVGGFDALTVYRLYSFGDSLDVDWMQRLSTDKMDVFGEITENASYHPIHIVANLPESEMKEESKSKDEDSRKRRIMDFWSDETKKHYPFLVVTLAYGAAHRQNESYEDEMWRCLSNAKIDENKNKFVIYNSINLCDLVILWYTNDISYTLKLTASISQNHLSRKTYTFVNLPLNDGSFDNSVKNGLLIQNTTLPICIRGTIRNSQKFYESVKLPLLGNNGGGIIGSDENCKICFGENDFMIYAEPDGQALYDLFVHFLKNSGSVDEACWSIYTEFHLHNMYPDEIIDLHLPEDPNEYQSRPPHDILSDEYARYLKVYRELHKNFQWANAFLELTNIHAHIDTLPVLHGPAYLVWGSLNIANHYFSDLYDVNGKRNEYIWKMLQESQNSIERFILSWNHLTDQITKVDDVIFHRLGTTNGMYNTLSESVLELYHLFLSSFSRALICSDKSDKLPSHTYGFLLAPTLSQRMRISKMFQISPEEQKKQQVYIIEFPLNYIYKPRQFVVHLAHECMHIFGEDLRMRDLRLQHMIAFTAQEIVFSFTGQQAPNNILKWILDKLILSISRDLKGIPFLEEVSDLMKKAIKKNILTPDFYSQLAKNAKESAKDSERVTIFQSSSIENWVNLAQNFEMQHHEDKKTIFFGEKVDACAYFFKECYADIMSIKLLGFSHELYLNAFTPETASLSFSDEQAVQFIQRIAIVLTAGMQQGVFDGGKLDSSDLAATLSNYFPENKLGKRIFNCIQVLKTWGNNRVFFWPPEDLPYYFSATALSYVVQYLVKTLDEAEKNMDYFSDVRTLYTSVIGSGNFFIVIGNSTVSNVSEFSPTPHRACEFPRTRRSLGVNSLVI